MTDKVTVERVIIRRLAPGKDLLDELTRLVRAEDVRLGALAGIGALTKGAVGIFDQAKGEYVTRRFDEEMEICALAGNVSLKDGQPFVHAHLTLADKKLVAYGGHMMPGNIIFVAEVTIWALGGATLVRAADAACGGLAVWALENVGVE